MYKKILRSLKLVTIITLIVLSALSLSLIYSITPKISDFIVYLCIILIFDAFIYIIVLKMSYKLTKSIVSPLTDYENFDITYDEIKPLMHKISSQSNEIKRQTDKAKSQKLQLKSVTSNMNEGLIILDEDGNVISINKCAQKFLNVTENDIRHKNFTIAFDDPDFKEHIDIAFSGKKAFIRISV